MDRIILIETSTALCSVALAENGKVVAYRENNERKHASLTAPFVKEILDEQGLAVSDCSAVCVSMGPGSYTGLRVGVSTAKGLCFGAGIPLLAISSLDTLVWQAISENLIPEGCDRIVPMIDARRMEVYTATYDNSGARLSETEPLVVEPGSFADLLERGPVLFIGDGASKCSEALAHPNAHFVSTCPKASAMALPAERLFEEGRFEDVAYFEPYYLKQFTATVSKKKLW